MLLRIPTAALVTLATALAAGCGGGAPAGGRAALVVDRGDGEPIVRCVELSGPSISGIELLERSGLELSYDVTGSMGTMVCGIAGTGCDFPREACLCGCPGEGDCRYWSLWTGAPGRRWERAESGAGAAIVTDGTVQGWRFGDGSEPPAAFDHAMVCESSPTG
jgi:hypothetical protein